MFASDLGDLFSTVRTADANPISTVTHDISYPQSTLSTDDNNQTSLFSACSVNTSHSTTTNSESPQVLELLLSSDHLVTSSSSPVPDRALIHLNDDPRQYSQPHSESSSSVLTSHTSSKVTSQFFKSAPQSRGSLRCPFCDKQFSNSSAIAKHKLTHSEERKYVCSICQKAFKRQDHLNGHKYTHEAKKPHACQFCDKSYSDARSLRRHYENAHPEEYERWLMLSQATNGDTSAIAVAAAALLSSTGLDAEAIRSRGAAALTSVVTGTTSASLITALSNPGCKLLTTGLSQVAKSDGVTPSSTSASFYAVSPRSSHSGGYSMSTSPANTTDMTEHDGAPGVNTVMEADSLDSKTASAALASLSSITAEDVATAAKVALLMAHPLEAPKRVACAVCQKRFKNQSALNGHMRLHGGYGATATDIGAQKSTNLIQKRRQGYSSSGKFEVDSKQPMLHVSDSNKSQMHSVEYFISSRNNSRTSTPIMDTSHTFLPESSKLDTRLSSTASDVNLSASFPRHNLQWTHSQPPSTTHYTSHYKNQSQQQQQHTALAHHNQGAHFTYPTPPPYCSMVESLKKTTSESALAARSNWPMHSDDRPFNWWQSTSSVFPLTELQSAHHSSNRLDSANPLHARVQLSSRNTFDKFKSNQQNLLDVHNILNTTAPSACAPVFLGAKNGNMLRWRRHPVASTYHTEQTAGIDSQWIASRLRSNQSSFDSNTSGQHHKPYDIMNEPFGSDMWTSSAQGRQDVACQFSVHPGQAQTQYSPVTPATTGSCLNNYQADVCGRVFTFPPGDSHELDSECFSQASLRMASECNEFLSATTSNPVSQDHRISGQSLSHDVGRSKIQNDGSSVVRWQSSNFAPQLDYLPHVVENSEMSALRQNRHFDCPTAVADESRRSCQPVKPGNLFGQSYNGSQISAEEAICCCPQSVNDPHFGADTFSGNPHSVPVNSLPNYSSLCIQPCAAPRVPHGRHSFPGDQFVSSYRSRAMAHCHPHWTESHHNSKQPNGNQQQRIRHISAPLLPPHVALNIPGRLSRQNLGPGRVVVSSKQTPDTRNPTNRSRTATDDQEAVANLLMQSHISDPPENNTGRLDCHGSCTTEFDHSVTDARSCHDPGTQSHVNPVEHFELADLTTGNSTDESDTSAITRLTKSLAEDNLFRNPHTMPPPKKFKRKPAPIFIPPQTGANLSRLRSPRVWTTEASGPYGTPPPYTPPPMLSPNRRGSGLFASVARWSTAASPARTDTLLARRNSSYCPSGNGFPRRRTNIHTPVVSDLCSSSTVETEGQLKRSYWSSFTDPANECPFEANRVPVHPRRRQRPTPKSAPILLADLSVADVSNVLDNTSAMDAGSMQPTVTVFGYDEETMRRFAEADAAADRAREDRRLAVRHKKQSAADQLLSEIPEKISKFEGDTGSSLMNFKTEDALELVEDTLAELDYFHDEADSSADEEYEEDEGLPSSLIPRINVGEAFQAYVPEFCSPWTKDNEPESETRETLLWCPSNLDEQDPKNIDSLNLLMKIACSPAVRNCGLNMEYTFHLLCKYKGNLEMTLHALLYETLVVYDYVYAETTAWTTKEIARFQHGLKVYGRDFHHVAKDLQANGMNKTVKACVEFYYVWKRMNTPSDVKWYREKARKQRFAGRNEVALNEENEAPHQADSIHETDVSDLHNAYNLRNKHAPNSMDHSQSSTVNHSVSDSTQDLDSDNTDEQSTAPDAYAHNSQSSPSYPCHLCHRVFAKVKSRNAHMKSHSDRAASRSSAVDD